MFMNQYLSAFQTKAIARDMQRMIALCLDTRVQRKWDIVLTTWTASEHAHVEVEEEVPVLAAVDALLLVFLGAVKFGQLDKLGHCQEQLRVLEKGAEGVT